MLRLPFPGPRSPPPWQRPPTFGRFSSKLKARGCYSTAVISHKSDCYVGFSAPEKAAVKWLYCYLKICWTGLCPILFGSSWWA